MAAVDDTGYQIGVGFSDAGSSVTQGDLISQHTVQHLVAQFHLSLTFCHAPKPEHGIKDHVNILVGACPQFICIDM
jgi:hypothetical protein